jgi:hypothetical protein
LYDSAVFASCASRSEIFSTKTEFDLSVVVYKPNLAFNPIEVPILGGKSYGNSTQETILRKVLTLFNHYI